MKKWVKVWVVSGKSFDEWIPEAVFPEEIKVEDYEFKVVNREYKVDIAHLEQKT